jgi:hypothetical protein
VDYREVLSEAWCQELLHDVPLEAAVQQQNRRCLTPANGVDAHPFRLDSDSFETPKLTRVLPRVRGTASNRIPEEWRGSNRRHGTLSSTEEGSEGLLLIHHVGGKHLRGDGSDVPRVVDYARRVKERVAGAKRESRPSIGSEAVAQLRELAAPLERADPPRQRHPLRRRGRRDPPFRNTPLA